MTVVSKRVPGFLPSTAGFRFSNSFAHVPDLTLTILGATVGLGDAANGLCGGMVFAARDYFEAGIPIPPDTTSPSAGPLFDYIVRRLFDSFNLFLPLPPPPPPIRSPLPPLFGPGPATYMWLMDPALPDHETIASNAGFAPRGRAWIMINDEWPRIRADLDGGHLCPVALIELRSTDPTMMGKNHQVLAYGYDLDATLLTLHVYDPNFPCDDGRTISLDVGDPQHTTPVSGGVLCFFRPNYSPVRPAAPGFGPNEDWTHGPFFGSRGTFFVDVTGDGKADAVAVNDDTVTVRRSTGSGFGPNEDWTHGPFFGSRGTFFVDVTGDGKADAVVVNDDTVTVRRAP